MASHEVGGDYFDVVSIDPKTWSVVIADVAGKGVSSALMASFLQGAFLNAAGGGRIADVLARINEFLAERADQGKYATVFYATLDADGKLRFSNAGHCAPLLVRKGGAVESLHTTSMPVGMVSGAPFCEEDRLLAPGDRVVLFTDGVTEAQNAAREFFGKQRLRDVVAHAAGLDCTGMHDAIQQALKDFTGGAEQSDDITLVVAEFSGV